MPNHENIFSFELHSLIPLSECKSVNDAGNSPTLKIFGRTNGFKSVCANIIAHLPYFYVLRDNLEYNLELPFGNDKDLVEIGINKCSYKVSLVSKLPFYNFHEGNRTFLKVECCSEAVRKRLIDFVKDSPSLYYNLYESHISFSLQFMSDFRLVGMGLVHVRRPIFSDNYEKSTSCDIECSFYANDIINTDFIAQNKETNALLPSLSLFMENLGISDLNILRNHSNIKDAIKFKFANLKSLWTTEGKNSNHRTISSKLKCPVFKSYIFRHPPPVSITDYYLIKIPRISKCSEMVSRESISFFTPVQNPPQWPDTPRYNRNVDVRTKKQEIEELTVSYSSCNNTPSLFNFNGDYYLKFCVLECYENSIAELPPLSTIAYSIICGPETKTRIFTTIQNLCFKNSEINVMYIESEVDMINQLIWDIVTEDPDVLVGFEIDNKSWGYISQRFDFLNGNSKIKFQSEISRSLNKFKSYSRIDPWIAKASSHFQVQGRITLNLWRIYRDEVPLRSYDMSNIYNYYFKKDIPHFSIQTLMLLMQSDSSTFINHVLRNLACICDLTVRTPFLVKSIEFSRLFGIDLFSTLTRGSQYKVESILITAAHSEGYLLRTPTEIDVRSMRAAQGLPLTMEPVSNYYRDPMVILDFQSLYPSMIIANNFCYSTVIGTVSDEKIISCGAISNISPIIYNWDSFSKISDYPVFKAPGNILFVRKEQKIGLLPRLLNEILATRVAIKFAMKKCDVKIKGILDARQLALKYISNVTYGYTSASFSGRMPNVDIADAIVLSGRKTLERAVDIIESHQHWEAKVVYGDTDSLFVILPGRSLNQAIRIGKEIADLVTSISPNPVALKFEKVYFPSVLMSKKRYCGYKYESEKSSPVFDAKGIETVRRDGCPLASKILEKSLTLLFLHNDEKLIKEYIQRQLIKVLTYQKINVADFVFAREVKFGTYKSDEDNRLPLSAVAAKKRQNRNPRDLIAIGQRVPFVIISKPFTKLYERVVDLENFLIKDYKIDVVYYATKQILTVLSRVFLIQGIDVWKWYNELPVAKLKQVSNSTNFFIFGRSLITEVATDLHKTCLFDDYKQDALKLQDLSRQDNKSKYKKILCCGSEDCLTCSCRTFWDRFNFQHGNEKELCDLKKKFNFDF